MTQVLFRIPLSDWVFLTIEKMDMRNATDRQSWEESWVATYFELGGISKSVSKKPCPLAASYGLWRSGRIVNGGVPRRSWTIRQVREEWGKNATYAHIALELLEQGFDSTNRSSLWRAVQDRFRSELHEEPAASEQGAVKIAVALFQERQIQ